LDGFFQAVSTLTAGFAVTNLQLLHPAVLVSYLVMMYVSVFPVAISIRRTNVYEEKSLGIWVDDDEEEDQQQSNPSFVGMLFPGDRGANRGQERISGDNWDLICGIYFWDFLLFVLLRGVR
jgi:Trk-type K+ transport system membrane component